LSDGTKRRPSEGFGRYGGVAVKGLDDEILLIGGGEMDFNLWWDEDFKQWDTEYNNHSPCPIMHRETYDFKLPNLEQLAVAAIRKLQIEVKEEHVGPDLYNVYAFKDM